MVKGASRENSGRSSSEPVPYPSGRNPQNDPPEGRGKKAMGGGKVVEKGGREGVRRGGE